MFIGSFRMGLYSCLVLFSIGAYAASNKITPVQFKPAGKAFPKLEKNKRKWDAPVTADLDLDGWPDLIINDHGYSIQIQWNNKGQFGKPWDLFMGDNHGVSIGDLNQDGQLEMIVSRGGGSGSNARNSVIFSVDKNRKFTRWPNFPEPLAYMRGRTVKFIDGDNDGDLDLLNFAFPSKEFKGASESYIYRNDAKGSLEKYSNLPFFAGDGQKTLITDYNNDGVDDLFIYGFKTLRAFKGLGNLQFEEVSNEVFDNAIDHVMTVVELDYDADGDMDLFVARGKDFDAGDTFYNQKTGLWGFFHKRGVFGPVDLNIGERLVLKNYQSPWPNTKVFTGEASLSYEFPGEKHSGQDLNIVNSDALGWPDDPSEKGLTLGYIGNDQWRFLGRSFSPMTLVIENVKDAKVPELLRGIPDLLLENKDGRFVDVSKKLAIKQDFHTTGAVVADIDNNGYEDLVLMPRGELVNDIRVRTLLNNGDATFTLYENSGIAATERGAIGMGIEQLDFDLDGAVDIIFGLERGKWHLFSNTNDNLGHYLIVDMGVTKPNQATSLGARVTVSACGHSQTKRLGSSSAAYSQSANRYVHFGLGECKKVTAISAKLTNGDTFNSKSKKVNRIVALR